jgi:hypothetical protein
LQGTTVLRPSPFYLIAVSSAKGPKGDGPRFEHRTYQTASRCSNLSAITHPKKVMAERKNCDEGKDVEL